MKKSKSKGEIADQVEELEEIAKWFEQGGNVDLEQGLVKVKNATNLLKSIKARLGEVENEFSILKNELTDQENNE